MYEATLTQKEPKIDWLLIGAIAGLMLVGMAFIYSATTSSGVFNSNFWLKQGISYGMGLVVAVAICFVRYDSVSRFAIPIYWSSIILLVCVFLFGKSAGGAKRWIDLGFFNFQPSEFAKVALIVALASYLSCSKEELRNPKLFLRALGMIALPFVLILKEPDLGSALVLFPIGLGIMFVAGVPSKYLVRFVGGVAALVILLLVDILFAPPKWQIKLEEYQRHRLLVYFGQDFAKSGATDAEREKMRRLQREKSYQVEQALISV